VGWLYPGAGFGVGVLVGLTGVGGGSLMTPLLVLLFGIHPSVAVGTDLLQVAVTKSVGSAVHGFRSTVDWRIVRTLAMGSVPATVAALAVLSQVDLKGSAVQAVLSHVLGGTLLLTALTLVFRHRLAALAGPSAQGIEPRRQAVLTVIVGVVVGFMVTVTSVGAGALGTTALVMLYPRIAMPRLVGSDIAHAVPLTLVAGLGHWYLGSIDWSLLGSLLVGSVPGIAIGSYLATRAPDRVLRLLLAVVLAFVGLRMVL